MSITNGTFYDIQTCCHRIYVPTTVIESTDNRNKTCIQTYNVHTSPIYNLRGYRRLRRYHSKSWALQRPSLNL